VCGVLHKKYTAYIHAADAYFGMAQMNESATIALS